MIKKYIVIALISIGLLIAATYFLLNNLNSTNIKFNGSLISPPVPAADFTLTDMNGKLTSLSEFRGKYLLIFFGFTSCTDICPATMAVLKQVRTGLGNNADLAQIVFISTDPDRDSPSAVKEFVGRFDPASMGFTGTLSDLEPVWVDYGVMVMDGGETHSSRVYVIDPDGNWRLTYPSATDPKEIISDLELLIQGY